MPRAGCRRALAELETRRGGRYVWSRVDGQKVVRAEVADRPCGVAWAEARTAALALGPGERLKQDRSDRSVLTRPHATRLLLFKGTRPVRKAPGHTWKAALSGNEHQHRTNES